MSEKKHQQQLQHQQFPVIVAGNAICIICQAAAVGVGPFSENPMCNDHLAIDVADVNKLKQSVMERLRPHSEGGILLDSFKEEHLVLQQKLEEMEHKFEQLRQQVEQFRSRVVEHLNSRLEAVQKCIDECLDIHSYDKEVQEASGCGNLSLVRDLAVGMQAHVGEIEAAFSRAARLRNESRVTIDFVSLHRLQQLLLCIQYDAHSTDVGVTARPDTSDVASGAETLNSGAIELSHELKMENWLSCVAVCSDIRNEFRSDRSGRVVPAKSAGDGSAALPQPCLVTRIRAKDHLTVLSLDGAVRLRSHCANISWSLGIGGLHGHEHLVFIAQKDAVTVSDLSGQTIGRIMLDTPGFDSIGGIGGNAVSLFVSSGNKIYAFSKISLTLQTVVVLPHISDADLGNLAVEGKYILVADKRHKTVHRVRTDTHHVVATYPTLRTGFDGFEGPRGVAIDSRGRVYVSERDGHSVRAVAADDGSLLWTLGTPGESGSGDARLFGPCGLVVVTGGPLEQLVVADGDNSRLLVLNLH